MRVMENPAYLNILVKPRIFRVFWGKNRNLSILKGEMPLKMHKIIYFFQEKKSKNKYVCLSYLKVSDPLPETHYFYLTLDKNILQGLNHIWKRTCDPWYVQWTIPDRLYQTRWNKPLAFKGLSQIYSYSPKFCCRLKWLLFSDWENTKESFATSEIIVPNGSIVFLSCCIKNVYLNFLTV